jgi:hypothetical protein
MRLRELGLWCVLMATVGVLNLIHDGGPHLWNDSYQYLSVAENLRDHGEAATSLVFFDSERRSGRIPAPITTFPPGYPAAIAAVAICFHCSLELAAIAVLIASLVAVAALLSFAGHLLEFPLAIVRLCLFLFILSSDTVMFLTTVASEALFTALAFGGILLLAAYERAGAEQKYWQLLTAFLLIGLAYWVRYVALFLFIAFLLCGALAVRRKRSATPIWLFSAGLGGLIIAASLLRETLIAGRWKGARMPIVHNPPLLFLRRLLVTGYNLLFATGHVRVDFLVVLTLFGMLGLLVLFTQSLAVGRRQLKAQERQYLSLVARALTVLCLCALTYCTALVYLGLFSSISFNARMFFPLLPVFLVLLGAIFTSTWSRATQRNPAATVIVMTVFLSGYAAGHIRAMWDWKWAEPAEHRVVAQDLAEPMANGQQLRSWIEENIPKQSPIMAAEGQATGFLLHRNTIGIPERRDSAVDWNEEQVRHTMERFGARYLILYSKLTPGTVETESESSFLNELTKGTHPAWLTPVARNADAEVLAGQP